MKISFPRERRRIRLNKEAGVFYIILGRGMAEDWWLQNFWDKPFLFKSYREALKGAKTISKQMAHYQWRDHKAVVAKIVIGRS